MTKKATKKVMKQEIKQGQIWQLDNGELVLAVIVNDKKPIGIIPVELRGFVEMMADGVIPMDLPDSRLNPVFFHIWNALCIERKHFKNLIYTFSFAVGEYLKRKVEDWATEEHGPLDPFTEMARDFQTHYWLTMYK